MYKQCRTEQSARRQRELERGLMEAMARHHYDEISVSDLCEELQIPRKSFYRYFTSKEGALYALIDHTLMDFEPYIFQQYDRVLQEPLRYMERVFSYWKENRSLMDVLERSGISGVLVQRAMDYSKQGDAWPMFLLNQSDSNVRNYTMMFTVCGLMTMIVQWHHDGFRESVEEMARIALHLICTPLCPDIRRVE